MRAPGVWLGVVAALALPGSAMASTTWTVSGTADDAGSAPCTGTSCPSLRDAVSAAQAGDTISLGSDTYSLNSALAPTVALTVTGQGLGATMIKQTAADRIFNTSADLTLSGLELTGAHPQGAPGTAVTPDGTRVTGGAVSSGGTATLSDVLITGNSVTGGAGASSATGSDGGAGGDAYGAAVAATGPITLDHCTISDNTATGGPGGNATTGAGGAGGEATAAVISVAGLEMTDSTVSDNTATAGAGGSSASSSGGPGGGGLVAGVASFGGGSITGSVITGNQLTGGAGGPGADGAGGAGGNAYTGGLGTVATSITDSRITDNAAVGGAGGSGLGSPSSVGGAGGWAAGGGVLDLALHGIAGHSQLVRDTVRNNHATGGAGGFGAGTGGAGGTATGGGVQEGSSGSSGTVLAVTSSTLDDNQVAGGAGGSGGVAGAGGDALGAGLQAQGAAAVTVADSTLTGNGATASAGGRASGGIYLTGATTSVTLDRDTLAADTATADTTAAVTGVEIGLDSGANLTLDDTIIAGAPAPGLSDCGYTNGRSIDDEGYNLQDTNDAGCGLVGGPTHDLLGGDPKLGDLAANGTTGPETRALAADSPALGAGGTCTQAVDERGEPRTGHCDIGAFQHQPVVATAPPQITEAAGSLTCQPGTFTGDGLGSASYVWLRDGTQVATASAYPLTAADEGHVLSCRETVTGTYGSDSATSPALAIPATEKTSSSSTTTTTTRTTSVKPSPSPVLSRVGERNRRWRESRKRVRHAAPTGTVFSFTLNVRASVTLTFTDVVTGRKAGRHGTCVKQTRADRRKASCRLTVTLGHLTVSGKAGANRVSFAGRVGRRLLGVGSYAVSLQASAGGRRSKAASLKFTIVR